MDPVKVLRLAAAMGAHMDRLVLVGCEPTPMDEADDIRMEMSEPVRAAVDEAVLLIESLIAKFLGGADEAVADTAGVR
jgi:hydrogenase maturation protease